MMQIIGYEHTVDGQYNQTIALLADGRRMMVNRQYGTVSPLGKHPDDCQQVTRMGGVCN